MRNICGSGVEQLSALRAATADAPDNHVFIDRAGKRFEIHRVQFRPLALPWSSDGALQTRGDHAA